MTCVMRLTRPRSIVNLDGFLRQNLKMESKRQSNGIWKTENGGRRSFPVNTRTIMRRCTAIAK